MSASSAVAKIVADLTNRRGLRQQWDSIDKDLKEEILEAWRLIVERETRGKAR